MTGRPYNKETKKVAARQRDVSKETQRSLFCELEKGLSYVDKPHIVKCVKYKKGHASFYDYYTYIHDNSRKMVEVVSFFFPNEKNGCSGLNRCENQLQSLFIFFSSLFCICATQENCLENSCKTGIFYTSLICFFRFLSNEMEWKQGTNERKGGYKLR